MIREYVLRIAWLTFVWGALWGDLSVGTLLGGALLAGILQWVAPWPRDEPLFTTLRPFALLRFVLIFLAELVKASLEVAALVLWSRRGVAEAIVAVPMRNHSERLTILLANCVTLTPGTLTVDCIGEPAVLYIHVLNLKDVDDVRRSVHRLEALAARAVGQPIEEAAPA